MKFLVLISTFFCISLFGCSSTKSTAMGSRASKKFTECFFDVEVERKDVGRFIKSKPFKKTGLFRLDIVGVRKKANSSMTMVSIRSTPVPIRNTSDVVNRQKMASVARTWLSSADMIEDDTVHDMGCRTFPTSTIPGV